LLAEFSATNQKVMDELKSYQEWLQKDLKPRAHGDFRIGAENYRRKLLYDEYIDIPLDRLLEIGMANLRLNQQAFKEKAAKIDPNKTAQQILEDGKDLPAPDKLLQTFRDTLERTEDFWRSIRLPGCRQVLRLCRDPSVSTSIDLRLHGHSGPFEKVARSLFQRHPAESVGRSGRWMSTWPGSTAGPSSPRQSMRLSQALRNFCGCHARLKIRKLLGCSSMPEGWALRRAMMLWLRPPRVTWTMTRPLKLRLASCKMLRNALHRRIEMHTGKMTFDQSVGF
jgi:hypothetical protein